MAKYLGGASIEYNGQDHPQRGRATGALARTKERRGGGGGEVFVGDAVGGLDVMLHEIDGITMYIAGIRGHTKVAAGYKGKGGNDAIVTGLSIVVKCS